MKFARCPHSLTAFPRSFTFYVARPAPSILSDHLLAEVRGLKHKNVAAELLVKLLGDEIRIRSKRNLVQSREFSEMLKQTLNAYHNRAIATQEVIERTASAFPAALARQANLRSR
ncbi:MAG TPA: type I restriction enzyme endonuclease domain-containing protein [Chthoniobacterales bacterium]|nr:type I restriction enzyme endonuclease domain-containing protein [Chthoniobacterales bacterium]